jgi:hypothetical protein
VVRSTFRTLAARCVLASLLVASVAQGTITRAQEPAEHHPRDDARTLFRRGAEAYADERYAEALEAFEASYRAREVPVVLFNLAQTLRALDRPAEAIEAYRRYLQTDAELDEERRAAVDVVIAELAPRVSFVRLEVFPDGAEVRVDGRSLGRAPFEERVAIDPGERRFEASAEGHAEAARTVILAVGERTTLRLALREAAPSGTLRLRANVAGASVVVDEEPHGVTLDAEPLELRLSIGRHELTIDAEGHSSHTERFELVRDEVRELDVTLTRRESLVGKWWLWAGVGGAVVVGVVIALAVALSGGADPLEGTLPTVGALWAR